MAARLESWTDIEMRCVTTMVPTVWVGGVAASCTQSQLGILRLSSLYSPPVVFIRQQFVNDVVVVMTW
jgi:hypothetical protein